MSSRVQVKAALANGTSLVVPAFDALPTLGNLLVCCAYSAGAANQSASTLSGFAQAVNSGTSNAGAIIFWRMATGTENTSFTINFNAGSSSSMRAVVFEQAPTTGYQWATTGLVSATGAAQPTTATTGTVTAGVATGGRTFDVACVGLGGTAAFLHTWTNSFTWDGGSLDRFEVATKDATVVETPSTTNTWDTSRVPRLALAAFAMEAAPPPVPTGGVLRPVSYNQAIASWDATPGAVSYDLELNGTVIAFDIPTNTYSLTGLTANTAYSARVRANS